MRWRAVRHRGGAETRGSLVALWCVLVLLAGCGAGVDQASTPLPPPPSGGSPVMETIEVGGRPVSVYVPASRPSSAAALVVALHGYGGDAAGAVDFFGLRPLADRRGFVVAAPQGTVDRDGKAFWNASRACCNFWDAAVDDTGHLSRVIATVVAQQAIDPDRVYVIGHSNGGFMAHRFACAHPGQVAAIASLAGALDVVGECTPTAPVSVLQVHGDADGTILFDGGAIDGEPYTSAM
ncbi:MAG TPA: alpha/beta fold hydrolase, partial [Propionicimonas sp.]|uniref:alpha/beta hydrolase family esterase n=1 Tax=Propionicimonas sp. TaxID=1955623 RepID=UPI002F3E9E66